MAYNAYYPMSYQPYQMQQPQPQQQNQGITWVQGEQAARSFMVGPGQSVMLMDSENSVFYIKSADQSGMPLPLRIFDYTERKAQQNAEISNIVTEYITREEFEKRLSEITAPVTKKTTTQKKEVTNG